jgi:hypothetical protein
VKDKNKIKNKYALHKIHRLKIEKKNDDSIISILSAR